MLFGGLLGLGLIYRSDRALGALFLATIAGSVALCLIAISKPRYSFVFDPVLILAAGAFVTAPRAAWRSFSRGGRIAVGVAVVFLLWAWVAWAIFAVTSRVTP